MKSGDILLYGCNVGGDDSGQSFIDLFAALTSADVAASDDLTGVDGDWELEVEEGEVEASVAIAQTARAAYSFNLAAPAIDTDPLTAGNIAYTENDSATQIAGDATLSDADGDADWQTGSSSITVQITTAAEAADELSIADGGDGSTITVSANELSSGGTVVADLTSSGTITSGVVTGSSTLVITFRNDPAVTNTVVRDVLRSIRYRSTSDIPGTTNRVVTVTAVANGETAAGTNQRTIAVTAQNDAPTLDLDGSTAGNNYATSFAEGDSPVAVVDTDVTITDVDDTNIESATITLTNAQTDDVLAAGSLPAGITSNIVGNVLTLSGSATLAQYQTALQAVTFENTNANPNTTNRTITVVVNDGANNSATATTTITVTSNDAPTLDLDGNVAGNNYSTSFTEDGAAVAVVDTDVTITDGDDTNIESATITLTNAQTDDVLAAGSLPAGITSNVVGNVLTLSGSATLAQYQTALQAVTFENTSENPNTTARTITIVVNDGVENSAAATTTITVNAADNDAPTLDLDGSTAGNNYATSFAEGDSPVAVVDTDVAITDVDDTNIESATITLTNAQTDDVLAAGSLPAGITSNIVGNVLTLSGSATLAQSDGVASRDV